MFTPQEVSEKVFPKASFGGYNMNSVDEFLDTLTEDYSALYKENATLKAKLKVLAEKVEEYRATEDAMRSTLLTAQRMAAQLVQEAQTEKDRVLEVARAEVSAQVGRLDEERQAAEQKLEMAKKELASFLQRSRELCAAQVAFLAQLPEMELTDKQEPAVPQDTIRIVSQDILRAFAEETEAAEEVAVDEPVVEAVEEEVPIAEAFRLDLDELKFGRNYNAE